MVRMLDFQEGRRSAVVQQEWHVGAQATGAFVTLCRWLRVRHVDPQEECSPNGVPNLTGLVDDVCQRIFRKHASHYRDMIAEKSRQVEVLLTRLTGLQGGDQKTVPCFPHENSET